MNTKSTSKTLRGGSVLKEVTFELRGIDEYGDAFDVQHCESLADAMKQSETIMGGECVAWVIEKHTAYYPARFGDGKYETIATGGDDSALRDGGWLG